MNPGILVPDIGHFKQIFVQAAGLKGFHENGFMGLGGAGGHHHPVQPVFPDQLPSSGPGNPGCRKTDSAWHKPRAAGVAANASAAATSTTPAILMPQLQTKTPIRGSSAVTSISSGIRRFWCRYAGPAPALHPRQAGRGAGFNDRTGDVLGSLEHAADIDAGTGGLNGRKGRFRAKPYLSRSDTRAARPVPRRTAASGALRRAPPCRRFLPECRRLHPHSG